MRIDGMVGIMTPAGDPGDPKDLRENADASFLAVMNQFKIGLAEAQARFPDPAASAGQPFGTGEAETASEGILEPDTAAVRLPDISNGPNRLPDPAADGKASPQDGEPSTSGTSNPSGFCVSVAVPTPLPPQGVQTMIPDTRPANAPPSRPPAARLAAAILVPVEARVGNQVLSSPGAPDGKPETGTSAAAAAVQPDPEVSPAGEIDRVMRPEAVPAAPLPEVGNGLGAAARRLSHEAASQRRAGAGETDTAPAVPLSSVAPVSHPEKDTPPSSTLQAATTRRLLPDERLVREGAALFFRALDGAESPTGTEAPDATAVPAAADQGGFQGSGRTQGTVAQGVRGAGDGAREAAVPLPVPDPAPSNGESPAPIYVAQRAVVGPQPPDRGFSRHEDAAPLPRPPDGMRGGSEGKDPADPPAVLQSASRPVPEQHLPGVPGTESPDRSGRQARAPEAAGPSTTREAVSAEHPAPAAETVGREIQRTERDGNTARAGADARAHDRPFAAPGARVVTDGPGAQAAQSMQTAARPSEFLFEVAERISMVVKSAGQEVIIRLQPDQLGRMSLVAQSGVEGLVARITTESAEVRQFLENNLPALQQALETQGLKVHHIDVLMQERFDLQSFGNMWQQRPGDAETGQGNARQDDFPIETGAAAAVVEELPLDAWTLAALHPHSTFHTIA